MRLVLCFQMFVIAVAFAQDCNVGGKRCVDHEQCCGGCCMGGECIDTYQSCFSPYDVCHEHSCIGAETCIVFVPPQCPGCEPIPVCKIL